MFRREEPADGGALEVNVRKLVGFEDIVGGTLGFVENINSITMHPF
jgi:hypothetical protein